MILTSLHLQSFRCFTDTKFTFHPAFNFISGQNGVGKTALLEAISLLSVGRSFRSREIQPLIHAHQDEMVLFANLQDAHTLSIQKSRLSPTQIKINTQACFRTSELTAFLPSQIIYQDLFQIIDAGPAVRRQCLDWGMFHVKQNYHEYLKQYHQALKQRNALLKKRANASQFSHWNQTLSELAAWIDEARSAYFNLLYPAFKKILAQLGTFDCELEYYNGWDKNGKQLTEVLESHYVADIQRQYTQFGIHHADLAITTETKKAKLYLSRGQQKILLLALKVAQAQLLSKPLIYIWDDVCSELDEAHLERLSKLLKTIPGQFFISGVNVSQTSLFQRNEGQLIEL
jgi:DNA replication and repair protein RecF